MNESQWEALCIKSMFIQLVSFFHSSHSPTRIIIILPQAQALLYIAPSLFVSSFYSTQNMSTQARLPLPSFTRKRKRSTESFGVYLCLDLGPRQWLMSLTFSVDQNEPFVRDYLNDRPICSDAPYALFLVYNAEDYDALTITSWWQVGRPSYETRDTSANPTTTSSARPISEWRSSVVWDPSLCVKRFVLSVLAHCLMIED